MSLEGVCPKCNGTLYNAENGSVLDYECGNCGSEFVFNIDSMRFRPLESIVYVPKEQPLENAVADDFNSSAPQMGTVSLRG